MGLYNFKKMFAKKIKAGEKTHTIRAMRRYPDQTGNTLHLYTGLRTKKAKLLMRARCIKIQTIDIVEVNRIHDKFAIAIDGIELERSECEQFARRDGFSDFAEMMKFWDGRLPFHGQIIHWRKWPCRKT